MKRFTMPSLIVPTLIASVAIAHQQQQASQPLTLKPHSLVAHLPGVENCPAPDWIVPGMRIANFTSVSQTPSNAGSAGWVVDPSGMITLDNGLSVSPDRAGYGIAGAGWDMTDVVAVEPGVIVLEMRSFQNSNGLQGPVTSGGVTTIFVHPSGCDFFIHPRLLAQLQQTTPGVGGNGVTLVRGQTQHRGATYNILLSAVQSGTSKEVSVYDLSSGVQLQHNSKSQFAGDMRYQPNGDGTAFTPESSTTLSLANNQFHGARKMAMPWPTMKIPTWVRTTKAFKYQGQRIDSGTPDMGLGRHVTNLTFTASTAHIGQTFIAYTTESVQQFEGMPAFDPIKGIIASGTACAPGLWMDPDCMKNLKVGQVIDSDANLGVQSMVEYVGPDRNTGKQVLVFAIGNQLYKSTNTYDMASGALIAMAKTEKSPSTGGTITTTLNLVSVQ